jgi:CTP-dependent riboflavin kinase
MYSATPLAGTGKATIMHTRRGPALEDLLGVALIPGTLNLRLDRPFDWSGASEVAIPDAVSWSALDGPWVTGQAHIQAVTVAGIPAWALRLHRSNAPTDLVEVLSSTHLRSRVPSWPAVLEVS